MEEINGAGGLREYIKQQRLSNSLQMEASSARGLLGLSENKRSGFWSTLTNSKNMEQTFQKLMREPVRLGPFSATIKGLATGFTALGPLVASVGGGLAAMAATIGGALTSALSIGIGGIMGFGQGLLGLYGVIQPITKEFHDVSLVTDAYARAVQKYGAGSKQATKAQEQMNNTLKAVSPTARTAYKDLAQIQTVFAQMTASARPALDKLLASAMGTFKTLARPFAQNTVSATKMFSGGMIGFLDRLKAEEKGGKGFLAATFQNANAAIQPLIGGVSNLLFAVGNIGAAASRELPKLARGFQSLTGRFFNSTKDKNGLNGLMDSLYKDFQSVGRTIVSVTKLLADFFNAGRSAGRGIFDSLTSTFDRWDRFINSNPQAMSNFFNHAVEGFKTLGSIIGIVGRSFVWFTNLTGPIARAFIKPIEKIAELVNWLLKLPGVIQTVQILLMSLAGMWVADKIMTWVSAIKLIPGALRAAATAMAVFTAENQALFLGGRIESQAVGGLQALFAGSGAFKGAMKGAAGAAESTGVGVAESAGIGATTAAAENAASKLIIVGDTAAATTAEVAGTATALEGLGVTLATLTGPVGLTVAGVTALGVAFATAKTHNNDWNKELNAINAKIPAMTNGIQDMEQAYASYASSVSAAAAADKAYANSPTKQNLIAKNEADATRYQNWGQYVNKQHTWRLQNQKDAATAKGNVTNAERDYATAAREGDTGAHLEGLRVRADQARAAYQHLLDTQKAFNDFSRKRVDLGLGGFDNGKLYDSLASIRSKLNNDKLTMKIATTVQTPEDMARVSQDIQAALSKHVKPSVIASVIARSHGLNDLLKNLDKLAGKNNVPTTIPVNVTGNAHSQLVNISNTLANMPTSKTISVNTTETTTRHTVNSAEGYMPAASGYMQQTAAASAGRRPMRRAMGKFNEPTFLVGEENRTEYVIATNPAYRSQNRMYLASAAHELGMDVMPAASGYSPKEIAFGKNVAKQWNKAHPNHPHSWRYFVDKQRNRVAAAAKKHQDDMNRAEALGFADTPAGMSKAEKAKRKRLTTLLRRERDYKTTKNPSATRQNHHNDDVNEIRSIRAWIKNSVHIMSKADSTRYKVLNTELGTYDSRMSLAEKMGDTDAFNAAQKAQEKDILELLKKDSRALKGARTADAKAQITAEIANLNEKLYDNRNRSIGGIAGALAQGQIDQLNSQLLSAQNEATINSMFGTTVGGLGDLIASGGPRMSLKGGSGLAEGGVNIHINTLTAHDPRHEELIRNTVVGALSNQGGVQASSMSVG
jgi:hypothetical protein